MEYSNLFVVLMGVGTVFFGLVCLIILVWGMGLLFRGAEQDPAPAAAPVPAGAARRQIANGGELLAAISAAIAEELGADTSAIRIVSIKKL